MSIGGTIASYFMLFFSIAAPGSYYVNDGLMNQRTSGIMFGGIIAVVGVVLYVNAPKSNLTIAQLPTPVPPQGFSFDARVAMSYPVLSPSRGTGPLSTYQAQLRNAGANLTYHQAAWAWSHGVPVHVAAHYVAYIEAVRAWGRAQYNATPSVANSNLLLKVGGSMFLLLIFLNAMCSAR